MQRGVSIIRSMENGDDEYFTASEDEFESSVNERLDDIDNRDEVFEDVKLDENSPLELFHEEPYEKPKLDLISDRKLFVKEISPPPTLSTYLLAAWPSAKLALLYISSFTTTLPVAVYALTFPFNISPELLTWELFSSAPTGIKVFAIALTSACLGIGTLVRIDYFPKMAKKLKEIFSHYCPSVPDFFTNNFILIMSGIAAVSALALGYYGFIWAGQVTAMFSAGINFLLTLGFRVISVASLINDVRNLFDQNCQFQKAIVNELKRIKPEHVETFENLLKAEVVMGKQIDEAVVRQCLLKIYDKASDIDLEDNENSNTLVIFNPPRQLDYIKRITHKIIDLGLGVLIGSTFFVFYAQNGFDGMKIIFQYPSKNINLDNWPYGAQMTIATLTGISSGILGFLAGMELSHTIILAADYMKNNALNAGKVILVGAGCGLSATSLASAAKVITDKANLFGITTKSVSGVVMIAGNWMLASSFDFSAVMSLLTKKHATYHNMTYWLERNQLSSETLSALRKHSYFNRPRPMTTLAADNDKAEKLLPPSHSVCYV
ncbi:MAG: hypothetical protein KIT56_03785 [Gammaproteobacteria bacterium]|nr:hypothetical protein [Gammaproteobacteria bacterium]MCW5582997.1 hypothetical protein [Gammaproteobacteria bacterium]